MTRRDFLFGAASGSGFFTRQKTDMERRVRSMVTDMERRVRSMVTEPLKPIVISVNALLDQGAHSGKGLGAREIAVFNRHQERARREYATSGILFDVRVVQGAYLRTQGYSEIPDKFLARKVINLFVTDTLAYDIDRDRTGGCSIGPTPGGPTPGGPTTGGPRPRGPGYAPDPFYKIFLGLRDAGETTLRHEYAHHFTLDTLKSPTVAGNVWADFRNEYWLWRQSHGVPILQLRACAHAEWADSSVRNL